MAAACRRVKHIGFRLDADLLKSLLHAVTARCSLRPTPTPHFIRVYSCDSWGTKSFLFGCDNLEQLNSRFFVTVNHGSTSIGNAASRYPKPLGQIGTTGDTP